jgi:DNA (cytosine-5)-methyltransferase 1
MNQFVNYRVGPQGLFNFDELVIDSFCGGGGASMGIEQALGRSVDIAINHDIDAIKMHEINHPNTKHYSESVWDVDPLEASKGQPVGLAWFSPDCKHHSKARGGKPVEKNIRGLAWVAMRWAALVKPRIIMLENVEEFKDWGPLEYNSKEKLVPSKDRKGETFRSFIRQLEQHGYQIEYKELIASDYGVATIRKRFYLIARCDNQLINWPVITHGNPSLPSFKKLGLKSWKTAADIIDWSIPCPSIFSRPKPLAEKTLQRIGKGIQRYVIDCEKPFLVPDKAKVSFITEFANASNQRNMPIDEPLRTLCAEVKGGHFAVVTCNLVKFRGDNIGSSMNEPLHTITAGGNHFGLVTAFLVKYYGCGIGQELNTPLHTITTKDRFALVTIYGTKYVIADIGLRMLQPHELYAAMGFPADYITKFIKSNNRMMTKADEIHRCGNAVCPGVARALVEANYSTQNTLMRAA